MMKFLKGEKVSEDDLCVIYRYGDLRRGKELNGSFRISKAEGHSVSTIELPPYTKERIDEMKVAGKMIVHFVETGEWPGMSMVY